MVRKVSHLHNRYQLKHTLSVKNIEPLPEIAELVSDLMPNATRAEQIDATQNLRAYLAAVYRIFIRLEAEANRGRIDDKSRENDRVEDVSNTTV